MLITGFAAGALQANCFVLAPAPGAGCVVVDPGQGALEPLGSLFAEHRLRPESVLLTHGHLDHAASAADLARKHGIPVWIHPKDEYMLDDPLAALSPELRAAIGSSIAHDSVPGRLRASLRSGPHGPVAFGGAGFRPPDVLPLQDGSEPGIAGLPLVIDHVPGHTPGSVLIRLAGDHDRPEMLITGDTLFAGSIGRTDLPGGSLSQELRSIRDRILTRPDAAMVLPGHGPTTTVGAERVANPFLVPDALAAADPAVTDRAGARDA